MMNRHDVDVSKINVGDRVRVSGAGMDDAIPHWGYVVDVAGEPRYPRGFYVEMDNPDLKYAKTYRSDKLTVVGDYYYAYNSEVHAHKVQDSGVPASEGATATVTPLTPTPSSAAHKVIADTLTYLQAVTGKEWEPKAKGVTMDLYGGHAVEDHPALTITFVPKVGQ